MIARLLTCALLLSLPLPIADADHHEHEKQVRTITVSGEGKVKTKPDTASISAGVVTEGETAREALSRNNDQIDIHKYFLKDTSSISILYFLFVF